MPTARLGIAFIVIGLVAMFLMYHLWGYPFDEATRTSSAPRWAMLLHRVLGYAFAAIYVVLMWKMVPRLWECRVPGAHGGPHRRRVRHRLPAADQDRDEWMPFLGTSIMLGTVILLGLSLPYALQEHKLSEQAFAEQNRIRVAQLLPSANLPPHAPHASELSTVASLENGRDVLLDSGLIDRCRTVVERLIA